VSEPRAVIRNCKLLLILFALSLPVHGFADETRKYVSPDGKLHALVVPVGKAGDGSRESRVMVRNSAGKNLLSRSFGSKDGEHRYIVYHADWTADSQFFVFSVGSSGGHQPWHSPIYFYCRSDSRLRLLDDYLGAITDSNFTLSAPDTIHATKLKKYGGLESVAVEAKLSKLIKQNLKR
jgi:hypothetical protein